jgi:hypothetical protein
MKKITTIIIGVLVMGLSQLNGQNSDGETMKEFLKGIAAFDSENSSSLSTIQLVDAIAGQKAAKSVSITSENIKDALKEAKQYKYCIITVEGHTIVKVTDYENCSQSGSWGVCMPFGEGFIRKGSLLANKDYINNIIGKPDSQARMMYLFN